MEYFNIREFFKVSNLLSEELSYHSNSITKLPRANTNGPPTCSTKYNPKLI